MWIKEHKKWNITNFDIFGPVETLAFESHLQKWNSHGGMFVTSMGVFMNNVHKLDPYRPHIFVIDETHLMKNKDTKIWQAVSQFKSGPIIAMSGTPCQNSTLDLFNILQLVQPGEMGNINMFKRLMRAGKDSPETKGKMQVCANTIHTMASKIMHRRDQTCLPLTTSKKEYIITFNGGEDVKKPQSQNRGSAITDQINMLKASWVNRKLLACTIIDSSVALKRPIVVFSFSKLWIQEVHSLYPASIMLTGDNSQNAQGLVDQFQSSDAMIFLSTMAGKLGLTLTKANVVLIADQSWNPEDDQQALSRVVRTGQDKDVNIYRLVCDESIEVQIKRQQIFKSARNTRVLDNSATDDIYDVAQFMERQPVDEDKGLHMTNHFVDPIWSSLLLKHPTLIRHGVPAEVLTKQLNDMITPYDEFHWKNVYYRDLFYVEYDTSLTEETIGIDCSPPFVQQWSRNTSDNKYKLILHTRPYPPSVVEVQVAMRDSFFHIADLEEWDWKTQDFTTNVNSVKTLPDDRIFIDNVGGGNMRFDMFFSLRVRPVWEKVQKEYDYMQRKEMPTHEAWSTPTMPASFQFCMLYDSSVM